MEVAKEQAAGPLSRAQHPQCGTLHLPLLVPTGLATSDGGEVPLALDDTSSEDAAPCCPSTVKHVVSCCAGCSCNGSLTGLSIQNAWQRPAMSEEYSLPRSMLEHLCMPSLVCSPA